MAELSRRGLFRAFRDSVREADKNTPEAMIARIGEACVEPRGVVCRRCGDECDPRAISFRLLGRGRAQPVVARDACTGCGQCLEVCPVHAIDLIGAERADLITGLAQMGANQ